MFDLKGGGAGPSLLGQLVNSVRSSLSSVLYGENRRATFPRVQVPDCDTNCVLHYIEPQYGPLRFGPLPGHGRQWDRRDYTDYPEYGGRGGYTTGSISVTRPVQHRYCHRHIFSYHNSSHLSSLVGDDSGGQSTTRRKVATKGRKVSGRRERLGRRLGRGGRARRE